VGHKTLTINQNKARNLFANPATKVDDTSMEEKV